MSVTLLKTPVARAPNLKSYAVANNRLAYVILTIDVIIFLASVFGSVIVDMLALKILFSSVAGFMIAQLFVIGHDAAHNSYVKERRGNVFIARMTFLPALHNYTLWLFVHNRLHHAYPNIKGYNSWSPLSYAEFQALPKWRQVLERIYRGPVGFGLFYLMERWLKDKFVPRRHIPLTYHAKAWRDFAGLVVYLGVMATTIVILSVVSQQNIGTGLLFGLVVPFIIWNYAMGLTVYQQHTSAGVKWYQSISELRDDVSSQSEVSIHIVYPDWYNFITHNCYYHPAHHVNAHIPIYNLRKAQQALEQADPGRTVKIPFSMKYIHQTLHDCKLYDYITHTWLDFSGHPTTKSLTSTVQADDARAKYAG